MCEHAQLEKILTSIAKYSQETFGDRLSAIILYGSYARGDYDAESDIDVMVLVDMGLEELHAYEDQYRELTSRLSLEDEDCTTISLILDSTSHVNRWQKHIPFYQNVMREGVRISA